MGDGDIQCADIETALYRHWDSEGKLLYVGISLSPAYRLSQHKDTAHWFRRIASTTIEWLPSRLLAIAAEREAIKTEAPECNIVHRLTAREAYLAEMAEESCAELTRKVLRFAPSYSIKGMAEALGMGEVSVRLALFHGDLPFMWTGSAISVTGWAFISYMEALQAGAVAPRVNRRDEDGNYPKPPNIEMILANHGITRL